MPFKSKAQQRYMYANQKKIGKDVVKEFSDATNFKKLPKRLHKKGFARRFEETVVKPDDSMKPFELEGQKVDYDALAGRSN